LLVVAYVIGVLVLRYTRFGRYVYAIGDDAEAARLMGLRTDRIVIGTYALSGALAGLAGVLQFSKLAVGDPTVAVGTELDVIAAVIIGGGSLLGGRGGIVGTAIGAGIMTIIRWDARNWGWPISSADRHRRNHRRGGW
jgi:ribose/xylose/arabinose/galactoside ABC-type transport system permease subunit